MKPKIFSWYAEASFAGTMAEYVHLLWHEKTVRAGPDYLPPLWLRRRFALFSRWFPGGEEYKAWPTASQLRRTTAQRKVMGTTQFVA